MGLQDKFDAALAILAEHNEAMGGKEAVGFIDPTTFITNVKLSGGTSLDRLKRFSYEDILQCMPTSEVTMTRIKPVALAKDIANIFRENPEVTEAKDAAKPVSAKKADRMSLLELVQAFDPEEATSAVGERLKKIANGQAFIVYLTNRIIDVTSTAALLQEIKSGYPGRATYSVGGETKKVHIIGDLPDNYADENPLYPGRPLRPDGTCDQLNRSWAGVSKLTRQFVRFASECRDGIDVTSAGGRDRAHAALDMALAADAPKKLRERYPEIAIKFDEAEKLGKLPNLLIPLGKPVQVKNPFDNGKQVNWVAPAPLAKNVNKTAKRGLTKSSDIAGTSGSGTYGWPNGTVTPEWIYKPETYTSNTLYYNASQPTPVNPLDLSQGFTVTWSANTNQ